MRWLTRMLLVSFLMAIALPADAAKRDVAVVDSVFDPVTVQIRPGDTVRWRHEGSAPHSVTRHSDGGGEAFDSHPDCGFETFPLCMQGGDEFEYTFSSPGTYSYYCKIHGSSDKPCQGMCGTVVVEASATAAPSTAPPTQAPATRAPVEARTPTPAPTPSPTLTPTPVGATPRAAPGADGGPSVTELPIALPERSDDEPTSGGGGVAAIAVVLVALAAGAGGFAWWRTRA